MKSINEAKRQLGQELRVFDGFVGVGVGEDSEIRVYVLAERAKAAQVLEERWGNSFQGFPVSIELSSGFRASSEEQ